MNVVGKYKLLCNNLTEAFQHKFKFELSSPIYTVAALLNVSKLNVWYNRADCLEIRRNAIDNIVNVMKTFQEKKSISTSNSVSDNLNKTIQSTSSCDSIALMLRDDDIIDQIQINDEIELLQMEKNKIEFLKEIGLFVNLKDKQLISRYTPRSTASFWRTNGEKFPILRRIAVILYNIPSSSAFIERFYSICGNVCKVRSGNINSDTIIYRSMLKANIHLLDELSVDKK